MASINHSEKHTWYRSIDRYLLVVLLVFPAQIFAQHNVPPTEEFAVTGAVKKEIKYTISDLSKFKSESLGDIVAGNKPGEPKKIAKNASGILLKTILDSVGIVVNNHKEHNEIVIVLTATDGYINVYSWNELFNSEAGNHVYLITEMDGESINKMQDRILVLSLSDNFLGGRHMKGLAKIEVERIK